LSIYKKVALIFNKYLKLVKLRFKKIYQNTINANIKKMNSNFKSIIDNLQMQPYTVQLSVRVISLLKYHPCTVKFLNVTVMFHIVCVALFSAIKVTVKGKIYLG